jgi:hypothetical protein
VFEAEHELFGMSADVKAARKVLGIEPGPIGSINEAHLYKAVNRVLAYRILDVCQWVRSEHPPLTTMAIPTLLGDHNNLLQKLVSTNPITTLPWSIVLPFPRKRRKCRTGLTC